MPQAFLSGHIKPDCKKDVFLGSCVPDVGIKTREMGIVVQSIWKAADWENMDKHFIACCPLDPRASAQIALCVKEVLSEGTDVRFLPFTSPINNLPGTKLRFFRVKSWSRTEIKRLDLSVVIGTK